MRPSAGNPLTRLSLAAALFIAGVAAACAADAPLSPAAPTMEMRARMATIHDQMAACLRSEKPVADCRAEMMASCEAIHPGGKGCQMGTGQRGRMGAQGTTPAATSGQ